MLRIEELHVLHSAISSAIHLTKSWCCKLPTIMSSFGHSDILRMQIVFIAVNGLIACPFQAFVCAYRNSPICVPESRGTSSGSLFTHLRSAPEFPCMRR